jgi:LemA protein
METFFRDHWGKLTLAALVLIIGFGFWGGHSSRVRMEAGIEAANAEIHNQYKRRTDLIPNLERTVTAGGKFEAGVLKDVIEARAKVSQINISAADLADPAKLKIFQDAQGQLTGALSRLLVTVERYPDIKTSQQYLALQTQLEGTENRITVARGRQIVAVRDFNASLRTLTGKVYVSLGFKERPQFEVSAAEQAVPQVFKTN